LTFTPEEIENGRILGKYRLGISNLYVFERDPEYINIEYYPGPKPDALEHPFTGETYRLFFPYTVWEIADQGDYIRFGVRNAPFTDRFDVIGIAPLGNQIEYGEVCVGSDRLRAPDLRGMEPSQILAHGYQQFFHRRFNHNANECITLCAQADQPKFPWPQPPEDTTVRTYYERWSFWEEMPMEEVYTFWESLTPDEVLALEWPENPYFNAGNWWPREQDESKIPVVQVP
jgi:hypothetical protein